MLALHTDLYQLTMAAGYFHRGMSGMTATCEAFVRRLPKSRSFLVAMGLDKVLGYLEGLSFDERDVAYLASTPALRDAMTPAFCDFLRGLSFSGDVWAVPEGTIVLPGEPLVRVRGPIVEAQLVETFVLSAMNHAMMIATKAARMRIAAALGEGPPADLIEFGTRRTHPEAAVDAARAACCVGFRGTSNVEAGRRFGLPVLGTAAHMWTMAHPSEEEAFEGYVATFPNSTILLIDTYDTLRGAKRAAAAARERLRGVRLDSGDLLELSRGVRAILDAEGLGAAKIVASGDLNEDKIRALREAKAPIDTYGIGTELVASPDAPAMPGVYKLVELERPGASGSTLERVPIAKFSEGKGTLPGAHEVHRVLDREGTLQGDVIALVGEAEPAREALSRSSGATSSPLLEHVVSKGARLAPPEPIDVVRARFEQSLASLPAWARDLEPDPRSLEVTLSPGVRALVDALRARLVPGAEEGGAT
jgi:nicotinate phosphoribosyltransferase